MRQDCDPVGARFPPGGKAGQRARFSGVNPASSANRSFWKNDPTASGNSDAGRVGPAYQMLPELSSDKVLARSSRI